MGSFDEDSDDRVGARQEPTQAQRADFEERLLDADIEGARLRAMSFAMARLRKNETMARQMADDAFRLCWERCTWDPAKVELGEYLCGVIRSQWSHLARDAAVERRREQDYVLETETLDGPGDPSLEDAAIAQEESLEGREAATVVLAEMRAHFEKAGDAVSLMRMRFMEDEIDSPAKMAELSGRPVEDFYRAADRCARLVRKLRARGK